MITPKALNYNPTGEVVFPSVIHASEHLTNPLGEWYLYYSPHETPGGISLAYADQLSGPWTEVASNPLISIRWPELTSNAHVASPDIVWNSREAAFVIYFHSDNDQTHYATSRDGVSFVYGGVAIDAASVGPKVTEASYARVFSDPNDPSAWAMFFMENTRDNIRNIRVARSSNGFEWTVDRQPLIQGGGLEGANVSGASLWETLGREWVVYHGASGRIYARSIDTRLINLGDPEILFRRATPAGEVMRVASPELVSDGDTTYLFYEAGDRLHASIRVASAAPCQAQ